MRVRILVRRINIGFFGLLFGALTLNAMEHKAIEPIELIVSNNTNGEINVTLGTQKTRLLDKDSMKKTYNGYLTIPPLKVESTKALYAGWWKPIEVNITKEIEQKWPTNPNESRTVKVAITSSAKSGYMATVEEEELQKEEREKTSLLKLKNHWEAFPAVQKEFLSKGWGIGKVYTPDELNDLLKSKDTSKKAEKIRLARYILNLPTEFSEENVRTNWRQQWLRFHYDHQVESERDLPNIKELTSEIIEIINTAKEILLAKK